jgi:hypothetical protein
MASVPESEIDRPGPTLPRTTGDRDANFLAVTNQGTVHFHIEEPDKAA